MCERSEKQLWPCNDGHRAYHNRKRNKDDEVRRGTNQRDQHDTKKREEYPSTEGRRFRTSSLKIAEPLYRRTGKQQDDE